MLEDFKGKNIIVEPITEGPSYDGTHPIEKKLHIPLYTPSSSYITGEYPVDEFFTESSLEENIMKIKSLRNRHLGDDVFLLGNSSDLEKSLVDKLRNKITFAANGFPIIKDAWNFEPTYMVADNPGVFDNHLRFIRPEFTVDGKSIEGGSMAELFYRTNSPFILSDALLKPLVLNLPCQRKNERVPFMEKHVHVRTLNRSEFTPPIGLDPSYIPRAEDICFDLEKGTFLFSTVIMDMMIPIAVWMGFKNIYLTAVSGGAAHFYDICTRNFWDENKQRSVYSMFGMFKKRLNEIGVNIYNLDRPLSDEEVNKAEEESLSKPNPTTDDRYDWKGPIYPTNRIIGKEPYIIEYKPVDEVL